MIYTKKGDDGTSTLATPERISKSDLRFELLGTVDELNSHLGLARALIDDDDLKKFVVTIQRRLIQAAAHFYNPDNTDYFTPAVEISQLEEKIDAMQKTHPLKGLVLPGGSLLSGELDIARTVARRAERCMIRVSEQHPVEEGTRKYLNRISDYLYMLARVYNTEEEL